MVATVRAGRSGRLTLVQTLPALCATRIPVTVRTLPVLCATRIPVPSPIVALRSAVAGRKSRVAGTYFCHRRGAENRWAHHHSTLRTVRVEGTGAASLPADGCNSTGRGGSLIRHAHSAAATGRVAVWVHERAGGITPTQPKPPVQIQGGQKHGA